jgi:ribosomal protein S6
MREYETVIVFVPDLGQEGLDAAIANVKKVLESNGATELAVEDWGNKDLPHRSKKHKTGRYYAYRFKSADHDVVNKSNTAFRIMDSLLKFESYQVVRRLRKFQGNPKHLQDVGKAEAKPELDSVS